MYGHTSMHPLHPTQTSLSMWAMAASASNFSLDRIELALEAAALAWEMLSSMFLGL